MSEGCPESGRQRRSAKLRADRGVHIRHRGACAPKREFHVRTSAPVCGWLSYSCGTAAGAAPPLRRFRPKKGATPPFGMLDRHRGGLACARPCHPPPGGRSRSISPLREGRRAPRKGAFRPGPRLRLRPTWPPKRKMRPRQRISGKSHVCTREDSPLLPTVDHVDPESTEADFRICGWRTNDCKNDLTITELQVLRSVTAGTVRRAISRIAPARGPRMCSSWRSLHQPPAYRRPVSRSHRTARACT